MCRGRPVCLPSVCHCEPQSGACPEPFVPSRVNSSEGKQSHSLLQIFSNVVCGFPFLFWSATTPVVAVLWVFMVCNDLPRVIPDILLINVITQGGSLQSKITDFLGMWEICVSESSLPHHIIPTRLDSLPKIAGTILTVQNVGTNLIRASCCPLFSFKKFKSLLLSPSLITCPHHPSRAKRCYFLSLSMAWFDETPSSRFRPLDFAHEIPGWVDCHLGDVGRPVAIACPRLDVPNLIRRGIRRLVGGDCSLHLNKDTLLTVCLDIRRARKSCVLICSVSVGTQPSGNVLLSVLSDLCWIHSLLLSSNKRLYSNHFTV